MKPFLIIFTTLFCVPLNASHLIGADISYISKGNNEYRFTVKFYRDCKGIPFNSPTMTIRCGNSGSTIGSPSYSRISIEDITPLCASAGKKCTPQNQTIGDKEPTIEEHTFTFDYDFSTVKKNGCCKVQVGVGQCCRNGNITTGGAGNDFWTYSELDICLKNNNSSPVFNYPPNFIGFCNQPLNYSFSAVDEVDGDSLSYSFSNPHASWSGLTGWEPGFNSQSPFTPYWPVGYDKSNGPNPLASPPIGIFLNPETGLMSATPTNCSEITILAVTVNEWRKDSTGGYYPVGQITRDFQMNVIMSQNNNTPYFSKDSIYSVCEGDSLAFSVQSYDRIFIPPPPQKTINDDTVKLSWHIDTKKASIIIDSSNNKQQGIKFNWPTKMGDGRTEPYKLTLMAIDNGCPYPAMAFKSYKIFVVPMLVPKISRTNGIDSVTYTDISGHSTGRKWYINSVEVGTDKTIKLSHTGVFGQQIRLELTNKSCKTDTVFMADLAGVILMAASKVRLYPNPTKTCLSISSSFKYSYEIYNTIGKLILKGVLNDSETNINVEGLSSGFYFIKFSNQSTAFTTRFEKIE